AVEECDVAADLLFLEWPEDDLHAALKAEARVSHLPGRHHIAVGRVPRREFLQPALHGLPLMTGHFVQAVQQHEASPSRQVPPQELTELRRTPGLAVLEVSGESLLHRRCASERPAYFGETADADHERE